MMELEVITIVLINGEPIKLVGGESKEDAIKALGKAIKLIKTNDVELATEEE